MLGINMLGFQTLCLRQADLNGKDVAEIELSFKVNSRGSLETFTTNSSNACFYHLLGVCLSYDSQYQKIDFSKNSLDSDALEMLMNIVESKTSLTTIRCSVMSLKGIDGLDRLIKALTQNENIKSVEITDEIFYQKSESILERLDKIAAIVRSNAR